MVVSSREGTMQHPRGDPRGRMPVLGPESADGARTSSGRATATSEAAPGREGAGRRPHDGTCRDRCRRCRAGGRRAPRRSDAVDLRAAEEVDPLDVGQEIEPPEETSRGERPGKNKVGASFVFACVSGSPAWSSGSFASFAAQSSHVGSPSERTKIVSRPPRTRGARRTPATPSAAARPSPARAAPWRRGGTRGGSRVSSWRPAARRRGAGRCRRPWAGPACGRRARPRRPSRSSR